MPEHICMKNLTGGERGKIGDVMTLLTPDKWDAEAIVALEKPKDILED